MEHTFIPLPAKSWNFGLNLWNISLNFLFDLAKWRFMKWLVNFGLHFVVDRIFLSFVKASHLLYQSYAQIWTFLLAWYFSSVISMKFVSSFDTLSLISPLFLSTNMSSMASTLVLWFSTFQWSEIYKFTLILIRRSHENRHAPK